MLFLKKREFKFLADHPGERLDIYLHSKLKEFSREKIKKLIKEGNVKVASRRILKPGYRLRGKELIFITIDLFQKLELIPQEIPLEIVYEDQDIVVVNKPPGMLTHPTSIDKKDTLVNALLSKFRQLSDIYGPLKPGIVHRLDKDTSGLIVIAKNNYVHSKLAQQFRNRKVEKRYLAVVEGRLEYEEGLITQPIARGRLERKKMKVDYSRGKQAETHFKVLKRLHSCTFVLLYPKTGRTHQLRVHMKYYGHPILGDTKYGRKSELIGRQALHSYFMKIEHPRIQKVMRFRAHLPQDFKDLLSGLGVEDYPELLRELKMEV